MTSTFISPILDFPVFIQCVRKSFKLKMPAVFTGNTQHVNSKRCQNRGSNALIAASQSKERVYERILNT